MKNTLALFAAAAAEVAHTRKTEMVSQAVTLGLIMAGYRALRGYPDWLGWGAASAIGHSIGFAVYETGRVYNRMKKEQKLSTLNNG